jgi:hypothetical protein
MDFGSHDARRWVRYILDPQQIRTGSNTSRIRLCFCVHLFAQYTYIPQPLPQTQLLQQRLQHLPATVAILLLQPHKPNYLAQMIHAPEPLLLPALILTLKPRQPKRALLLRNPRIRTQLPLGHLSIPVQAQILPDVARQDLPQHLQKPVVTVRLRDVHVGVCGGPEFGEERLRRGFEVRWGVLGVQVGEGAVGLQHVDREAWWHGGAGRDGEEVGPAEALGVDPDVFVFHGDGCYPACGLHEAAEEDGDSGYGEVGGLGEERGVVEDVVG